MPSDGDSAHLALLAKIRQLEGETARLRLLIAELLVKNQHLRETGVEPGSGKTTVANQGALGSELPEPAAGSFRLPLLPFLPTKVGSVH
jgi:hypothetical protein